MGPAERIVERCERGVAWRLSNVRTIFGGGTPAHFGVRERTWPA